MPVKKSDLYSSIWASCDQLRGGMDASQYKDYVLFMLFIKYVSDKYADSDDFAPLVKIPRGASFRDMVALKGKSDIGDRINTEVIRPLIDANPKLASSDFPNFNDAAKLGEGPAMVTLLTNLIAIFEKPELDFSKNRAEHDDLLGDAYEYLMRHFATDSGKSKGQFYTPSEVSRVIAKVIGISGAKVAASTRAYDPTCGSGSLLLKVAAEARTRITLEGQEKDVTTAGLARMNMILHGFATATIMSGDTLADPKFKFSERMLKTYDYVVANPPFSDKAWSNGVDIDKDPYGRFSWGVPPLKQGNYAYLLHILRSMRPQTGKGACILPHGVLFRGNAEAVIREQLVRSGILKGVIGLPANLFYGTGIPACILVLDKENATARKGVFLIDASKGFIKDGAKNRLREQDIHKIVDTFLRQVEIPRYSRMIPLDEIADPRNDFNLNLPRYIDTSEPEDLQDIEGHLQGGIPVRDVDALGAYWKVMPKLREELFEDADRPGYCRLRVPAAEVKKSIFEHRQFLSFRKKVTALFEVWRSENEPQMLGFGKGGNPKQFIELLSEGLLASFEKAPLLDPYDLYQRLMELWMETMQDDAYLIATEGWLQGAQPREIVKVKNKDGKFVWPEEHDFLKGTRRFKSDLVPAALVVDRFLPAERDALTALDEAIASLEQKLEEQREEHGGEEGLLAEVVERDGDKIKISPKAVKDRLKAIAKDRDAKDERKVLQEYQALLDELAKNKAHSKTAKEDLDEKTSALYDRLTLADVQALVVQDKWLARLTQSVQSEMERVSQGLTTRVKVLAERYETPLPKLSERVNELEAKVSAHLAKMGFQL